MAVETNINVQPAGPASPTVPVPLMMVRTPDGNAGVVLVQAMMLVTPDGDPFQPMTEATGREMVSLLRQILTMTADANGAFRMTEQLDPE